MFCAVSEVLLRTLFFSFFIISRVSGLVFPSLVFLPLLLLYVAPLFPLFQNSANTSQLISSAFIQESSASEYPCYISKK